MNPTVYWRLTHRDWHVIHGFVSVMKAPSIFTRSPGRLARHAPPMMVLLLRVVQALVQILVQALVQ